MSNHDCLTEQQITLYCYRDLEIDQMQAAAEHFAACQTCRDKMASIKSTIAAIPQAELTLSDAETRQFSERVLTAARKKQRGFSLQALGAAATAVTAGAVAVMVFTPANLVDNSGQNQTLQYAELDLVENMEMLENMELLELIELLEALEDKG